MGTRATELITQLAANQHGAVAIGQLEGVSRRWVDNLVRRGVLRRAASGVYVLAGSPDTWSRRLTVGLLALGAESWVSHDAAAKLHKLDRAPADAVEFTVPRAARGRRG